jgi:hypothetical protein
MSASMPLVDMISNVGGILSLFSGMSILSLVEIVYWMACLICQSGGKPSTASRIPKRKRK